MIAGNSSINERRELKCSRNRFRVNVRARSLSVTIAAAFKHGREACEYLFQRGYFYHTWCQLVCMCTYIRTTSCSPRSSFNEFLFRLKSSRNKRTDDAARRREIDRLVCQRDRRERERERERESLWSGVFLRVPPLVESFRGDFWKVPGRLRPRQQCH